MKRVRIFGIATLLLLSLLLSSCAFGDWVNNLFTKDIIEKVTYAMGRASSVRMDGEVSLTLYVANEEVKITGRAEQIYSEGRKKSDLYYYAKESALAKIGSSKTSTTTIEAYQDGNFFYSMDNGTDNVKAYSENTRDEFLTYYKNRVGVSELSEGYGNLQHFENEDGTHTLVMSQYSDAFLGELNSTYALPMEEGGAYIVDCVVSFEVNEDYLVTSSHLEYIFSDEKSKGSQTLTYSGYGEKKRAEEEIVAEEYTKVDDARILPMLTNLLMNKKNSDDEYFEYSIKQEASKSQGYDRIALDKYEVDYGTEGGKYFCRIVSESEGVTSVISYGDNVLYVNGVRQAGQQMDLTMKAMVNSLIDPFFYSPVQVTGVQVEEEGDRCVYLLTLSEKNATLKNVLDTAYSALGGKFSTGTITLEVIVQDGELQTLDYHIEAEGTVGQFRTTLTMDSETKFCEPPVGEED